MPIHRVSLPGGPVVQVTEGETVLDACLRQGTELPFSCRGGTCHTCVQRCIAGAPPARATRGLSAELQALGYFLPCVCEPIGDLVITPPDPAHFAITCVLESATENAIGGALRLEPMGQLAWRLGLALDITDAAGHTVRGQVFGLPEENYYADVRLAALPVPSGWSPGKELRVCPAPESPAVPPAEGGGTVRPAADPGLWHELGDGRVVRAVLDEFYLEVFADPVLAPYFRGTTQDHVAGKQYAFLRKSMTGEEVYFGDNPRDAHHWMVIPPAVFDHRQALMAWVQRRHSLTPDQMRRWAAFELPYRADIVKDQPLPVRRFGVELPLDGLEPAVLDVGYVCDSCGGEVQAGQPVLMHRRLGTISCAACSGTRAPPPAEAAQADVTIAQ